MLTYITVGIMRLKEKFLLPCCILLVTCFVFATAGPTLEQFCQSDDPVPVNAVCSTLGLTGNEPAVCPGTHTVLAASP
jgi:hypothetical protein